MHDGIIHVYGTPNGKHHYSIAGHAITQKLSAEQRRSMAGMTFFMTKKFAELPAEQICNELMELKDSMFGRDILQRTGYGFFVPTEEENDNRNNNASFRHLTDEGRLGANGFTILDPAIFGLDPADTATPTLLEEALENKLSDFLQYDIRDIRTSVASTAHGIYNSEYAGAVVENENGEPEFVPEINPLPSRWRRMAKAAFHGGPIACMRGGSKDAVEVDIRGAYLEALRGEMPLVGRRFENPLTGEIIYPDYYAGEKGITWETIQNRELKHGFIDATVYVREDLKHTLPPLPLSTEKGLVFPRGRFRGVWTLPLLQMAYDYGEVHIEEIHHSFFARYSQKIFYAFSEYLKTLPKSIGKELYVKFWGKFNQDGGFKAVKLINPDLEYKENGSFALKSWGIEYSHRIIVGNDGEKYLSYSDEGEVGKEIDYLGVMLKRASEAMNRGKDFNLDPESPIRNTFDRNLRTLQMNELYRQIPKAKNGMYKHGMYWWSDEKDQLDDLFNSKHRPDLAAYISSYNIMNVYKGIKQLKPESIIAVHVDAIWTDDIEGAKKLCESSPKTQWTDPNDEKEYMVSDYGGWAIKRRGELRFYAAGVYVHKGNKLKLNGQKHYKEKIVVNEKGKETVKKVYEPLRVGCSGYDSKIFGPACQKSIENWIQNVNNRQKTENTQTRDWLDKNGNVDMMEKSLRPEYSQDARSQSPLLKQENPSVPFDGIDFWSPDWVRNGDHVAQIHERERRRQARLEREERQANRTNQSGDNNE
jgi:hypothetical protein